MARRGRKTNWDKKIAELIADLRRALVAREQDRIEATVAAQMSALVGGLQGLDTGIEGRNSATAPDAPAAAPSAGGRGNRKPRSAESKAKQAAKMRAYWRARKAAESKAPAPKKAKAKKAPKSRAENAEAPAAT